MLYRQEDDEPDGTQSVNLHMTFHIHEVCYCELHPVDFT